MAINRAINFRKGSRQEGGKRRAHLVTVPAATVNGKSRDATLTDLRILPGVLTPFEPLSGLQYLLTSKSRVRQV